MPLFDEDKFYRTRDIEGPDRLCPNRKTREAWTEREGVPVGRMTGHLRTWTGKELNDWWATRSTKPMPLPEGVGGIQPGSGRPRKTEQAAA